MNDLPTSWSALCALVFLLGMRHGFDADHLAAIDGLARLGSRRKRAYAPYSGALFSIGHGSVVVLIALGVGLFSERWSPPTWLDATGALVSIGFLLSIGFVNLRAVLRAPRDELVPLVGVKGPVLKKLFGRVAGADSAAGVATVGALFAISFDTVSQAALFAVTAAQFGGVTHALTLGALFVLGMLATDGLNGWWISRLISRADQTAAIASRIMSVAVSCVSLLVAAFSIGKLLSPAVEAWGNGKELVLGLAVVLLVAVSYLAARWLARVSKVRGVVV